MKYTLHWLGMLLFWSVWSQAQEKPYTHSQLQAVPFQQVRIDDPFWSPRIETIQKITIPLLLDVAEKQGKIDNFRIVAGKKTGKLKLYNAPDSDVYKILEAMAYTLAWKRDARTEAKLDSLIVLIAAAQQPNGYLNTQFSLPLSHPASPPADNPKVKQFGYGPDDQWNSTIDRWPYGYSQLYCAGHLMEAAVAHYRVTGKSTLLHVATRLADNIGQNFTKEKIETYGEHPEVEIGLMQLYEVTQNPRYLELADLFSRYVKFTRPPDLNRTENSKPLADQREAFGHCVRTAYIYAGATDVVRATGASDLKTALGSLWSDITAHKMYVHGGTGNGSKAEQHGHANDLPIGETYSETCANIAQGQWNHRLHLLTGEARYMDVVDMEAYNSSLSGISLDGKTFFYANKLNMDTTDRKNEHSGVRKTYLFCCPSKVPGFIPGIARWIYAKTDNDLYVNMYVGSELTTQAGKKPVHVSVHTTLPYQGSTTLQFLENTQGSLSVRLRIPSYASGSTTHIPNSPYYRTPSLGTYSIKINNKAVQADTSVAGYASLTRVWQKGDQISIEFMLQVQRVYTQETITANTGRVALMRGPLLYCLEGVDNKFDVLQMVLPKDSPIIARMDEKLLGGTWILTGKGVVNKKPVTFKAIPYFLWENRGISPLSTLLIQNPEKINVEPKKKQEKMNTNG